MDRRKRAKSLLRHYLTLAIEHAGGTVNADMQWEIADIIDLIFDEIQEHKKE